MVSKEKRVIRKSKRIMNYKRTQHKNARLRNEKLDWLPIYLAIGFMLVMALFGPDLLKLLR